jgi:hypothetical protein
MSTATHGEFNESPNHFMVLDAVSRGTNNVDKITRVTKLQNYEVQTIVNDLLTQRLIVKIEKKGFLFGKKKVELGITEMGIKLLNAKKQELEQQKQQMQESYENGDGTQLQSYMDANRMWMPMMLFSGIMDMMFFTSMMSFMGMGMNPMESSIIGSDSSDSHHHDAASGDVNDQTGGDTGGSDYDNSGFDGFDGGGFDSF